MKYRPKRLRRLERVWLADGQPTCFITIGTESRRAVLANEVVHQRLREFLVATRSHHDWWAGQYVIMPDHLHLFAIPGARAVSLGAWIKALKAVIANREFKWQAGFFDHALRSSESQSAKWEYIRQNPVRAGLVASAEAWPFGGDMMWDDDADSSSDRNRPPRQETRPTTELHPTPPVGPVSRPGAGLRPPHEPARAVHLSPGPGASSRAFLIHRYAAASATTEQPDEIATEAPLEIRVEGHSVAVVMRTPGHDRELAAGFLLTENLVRRASEIFEITQCGAEQGDVVNVALKDPVAFDPAKLTRNVFSSSSCGVCSKATLDAVRQTFPPIESQCAVPAQRLLRMPAALRAAQATFARTGGLHACALFDAGGNLQQVREDVGRHNALDKLIGRALLEGELPLSNRVLFLSGRVSFEMMQKALAAGIPIVAAISAPTTLAVEFARANNQTLAGFVRGETMNVYAGAERIVGLVS